MKCKNCGKVVDPDSAFCIYCGSTIEKDTGTVKDTERNNRKQPKETRNDDEGSLKKEPEEEKSKSKKLDMDVHFLESTNKRLKNKITALISVLSVMGVVLLILIIILSNNLAINKRNAKTIERGQVNLQNSMQAEKILQSENEALSQELTELKSDYNVLKLRYDRLADDNIETTEERTDYTGVSGKDAFLNNIYHLLGDYNSAANHMDAYHQEDWVFSDPGVIAFQETYLAKLQELSNKLKGFSYPSSFSSQRNELVSISEEICHYESLSIECMKNNDYPNYVHYLNARNNSIGKLFNYYNSLVN